MFGRKNKRKLHNHIDTLIGVNTGITGDITFSGGLRVDGHIIGNVSANDDDHSTLVLSNEGSITGKISVTNIVINGTVSGPIYASGYLELQTKAKVYGDIHYGSLEIQLGASVEGKMIHYDAPGTKQKQTEKMVTLISAAPNQQPMTSESEEYTSTKMR
ncbi:polymer-forming cytoskeletal protein [Nitrosomonas sp. JL21]|uniref:bactofilin family protein n=1 Tax=Nitrosomonas sp. JL21 TaxID=153949 RepID=UPI00136B4DDD|nr:polymer-forming cytoskeletal protein [Nitrosomonas sp. JL21]MBL8498380.1 polymer-forming cytoskeletal protein [Nitrosomonas sp.]MCC7091948.1 polymer-forming cytoskeletal protein [Nitrosomonas sp.]MXS78208.1 polymer-forming cytoskeletal protein [Nitrosomonas sp. JL21]